MSATVVIAESLIAFAALLVLLVGARVGVVSFSLHRPARPRKPAPERGAQDG